MSNLIGQSLGRYHILEQLGEGGMATVYKAYDTRLERDVAIKVIRVDQFPPAALDRILKRFERESKALARLTHPNIVHINDYGEHGNIPYLVMDYLPGGTLKERMKGKPMPWQEAIHLLLPIVNALGYAHEHKVVHRDVKPANILLTENGQPMLTDFGIAKILELEDGQTLTGTGMGVGTPEYMSPEQGLGREVDGRADIYSMGIILYELITGRKPYTADTPMAVIFKHMTDPLIRPRQLIITLPEKVEHILIKALAKDPNDRYPDFGAFSHAIESLLGGEQSSSKPAANQTEARREPSLDTIVGLETELTADTIRMKVEHPISTKVKGSPGQIAQNKIPWLGLGVTGIVLIVASMIWLFQERFSDVSFKNTSAVTIVASESGSSENISALLGNDGMALIYVPKGEFNMGSSSSGFDNQKPVHTVYLEDFWIDQTEITNSMYALCVKDGKCSPPANILFFSDLNYGKHPVISVNWNDANTYCNWVGRRLPTEAEWEKAARGTDDRIYPWGDNIPNNDLLNFNNGDKSVTMPVGNYPGGASPYGVFDMAGNAWEWVADWFDEAYYQKSGEINPLGPSSGQYRVIRDSHVSATSGTNANRIYGSSYRSKGVPTYTSEFLGFRCASDTK